MRKLTSGIIAIAIAATVTLNDIRPSHAGLFNAMALKAAVPGNLMDVRYRHGGAGVAAGIAFGLIGAAIASQSYSYQPRYYYSPPIYYYPSPVYYYPYPVYYPAPYYATPYVGYPVYRTGAQLRYRAYPPRPRYVRHYTARHPYVPHPRLRHKTRR